MVGTVRPKAHGTAWEVTRKSPGREPLQFFLHVLFFRKALIRRRALVFVDNEVSGIP